MPENDFDTNGRLMENTASEVQSSDNPGDVSGAGSAGANPAADDNPAGQDGSVPGAFQGDAPLWGAPAFPQAVSQARKDKLASILAGTYSSGPHYPELNAAHPGAPGMHQEPGDGPLIGPDGGMVGRGIKAAGDWYQGYINEHREGLMEEMKDKLTPSPVAIDALETSARATLARTTGIVTDFEPKYPENKILGLATLGPGGPVSVGRMIVPAVTQAIRSASGEFVKPEEAVAGVTSVLGAGALAIGGVANPMAQRLVGELSRGVKAAAFEKRQLAPEF